MMVMMEDHEMMTGTVLAGEYLATSIGKCRSSPAPFAPFALVRYDIQA